MFPDFLTRAAWRQHVGLGVSSRDDTRVQEGGDITSGSPVGGCRCTKLPRAASTRLGGEGVCATSTFPALQWGLPVNFLNRDCKVTGAGAGSGAAAGVDDDNGYLLLRLPYVKILQTSVSLFWQCDHSLPLVCSGPSNTILFLVHVHRKTYDLTSIVSRTR